MSFALVVTGAAGRMGRLVAVELRRADFGSVAGFDPAAGPSLELADGPLPVVPDLENGLETGGVVVDFSHPGATDTLCDTARARKAALVIGTTGQSSGQLQALREVAREVPVVLARNFSLGVNRILQALPALRVLAQEGFDVECVEAHHRRKRDAPSGTALLLLEALLGPGSESPRVHGRYGAETGRVEGEVGVHSLRLGDVAGEHAILLAGDHELIEIRHRAFDRAAFVTGVVPAVRFTRRSSAGLYSMLDVMRDAAPHEP